MAIKEKFWRYFPITSESTMASRNSTYNPYGLYFTGDLENYTDIFNSNGLQAEYSVALTKRFETYQEILLNITCDIPIRFVITSGTTTLFDATTDNLKKFIKKASSDAVLLTCFIPPTTKVRFYSMDANGVTAPEIINTVLGGSSELPKNYEYVFNDVNVANNQKGSYTIPAQNDDYLYVVFSIAYGGIGIGAISQTGGTVVFNKDFQHNGTQLNYNSGHVMIVFVPSGSQLRLESTASGNGNRWSCVRLKNE